MAQFGTLTLTESKVRHQTKLEIGSALLSEVNAITTRHRHFPILIALGLLVMLVGAWASQERHLRLLGDSTPLVGLAIGAGLVVAYFLTRRTLLMVHAGTAVLSTGLGGGGFKKAEEFINAVETAKARYESPPPAP